MSSHHKHRKIRDRLSLFAPLFSEYVGFLRTYRGVSEATIVLRRNFVAPFLLYLEQQQGIVEISHLKLTTIHDYVIETAKPLTRASRKHLTSSLRSFLRFAHIRGYFEQDLTEAIPVIVTRRLDRLPRTISWEAVQKLLKAPDRSKPAGRRDYAILLLLASYGVRIGQVTHMHLRDIDWKRQLIFFQGEKGGKPLCFPLKLDVAEAILSYLRCDRRQAPYPEVFLTVRGKPRPLSLKNHLGTSFRSYYERAGIEPAYSGSHPIRHAFATRLLKEGTPLKTISDLLGHRSIETTFVYTKIDLDQLRSLAVEWLEVKA